jgi:hypothetical protein
MAVGGMRQHRHLFILTVFLSKVVFNGIKGDRVKIVSFNAAVIVPSVYFAIVNDLVAMQMTMHIAPVVSRKA